MCHTIAVNKPPTHLVLELQAKSNSMSLFVRLECTSKQRIGRWINLTIVFNKLSPGGRNVGVEKLKLNWHQTDVNA